MLNYKDINKNIIIILFVIFSIVIINGCSNDDKVQDQNNTVNHSIPSPHSIDYCENDEDCVPAQCCHPTSCIHKSSAPDCSNIMCTMECKPDTMDCGQGRCRCINNNCEAVIDE